jgi:uncharacterized protein (DUF58 family)
MTEQESLLDPGFMRRLEQLQLLARRVYVGRMKGERRSALKGISTEFADYRQYVRGDDLRFIDWNIYGRLDRLFLKLFYEEQDLHFYVLFDTSGSMDYGDPKKVMFAKRTAAALAYIGLANLDRVAVAALAGDIVDLLPPTRGKAQARKLLHFLEGIECDGETALYPAARQFLLRYPRRGLGVLITDFLDPSGYEDTIRLFLQHRWELFVVHVLSREEREPEHRGNLKLVDCETGQFTEVTVNQYLLNHYRRTVREFCASIKEFCTVRGVPYFGLTSDFSIERMILEFFRKRGVIK